jgi:peptidoglycan hydrolase-like protein with peptidoglycan-binding domain
MRKLVLISVLGVGLVGSSSVFAQGSGTVRAAQQALKDKGIDPGPIDGVEGPQTHAAVRRYQEENHILANGRLGGETYDSLGVKRDAPGEHMDSAGEHLKSGYGKGGKDLAQGGKDLGSNLKHGQVADAGKDFGVGVGRGAAKMGVGTGKAAKSAGKAVKDAFTPSEKKKPQP